MRFTVKPFLTSVAWLIAGALAAVLSAPLWAPATPEQMLARPCPPSERCHQTWTLSSRLGQVLEFYEERVGPRNSRIRLLGIEFTAERRPGIRFVDYGDDKRRRSLIIQLTQPAATDEERALFQLAHEAFHIIEPVEPGKPVSYLEEGLASFAAIAYLRQQDVKDMGETYLSERAYVLGYELVSKIAKRHSDFWERLKRLREQAGSFSDLSNEDIRRMFPGTSEKDARQLATKFP